MFLEPKQTKREMNNFPRKLYQLLQNAESLGYSDVISWQAGGKSFKVHRPKVLEGSILPQHFKQSKFKSFLRQLNTYHFQRITSGVNRGGYGHPCLVRGKPELCRKITRIQDPKQPAAAVVKSSTNTTKLLADTQRSMAPRCPFGSKSFFDVRDTPSTSTPPMDDLTPREQSTTEITSKDLEVFVDLFEPSSARNMDFFSDNSSLSAGADIMTVTPSEMSWGPLPSSGTGAAEELLEPIPVLPASTSSPAPSTTLVAPALPPVPSPTPIAASVSAVSGSDLHRSESTFPRKVFRMLQDVEKNQQMDHIVSWINNGTAFRIHNQDAFVKQIMPLYFDQTVYESFRRQLNMYGFNRVTRGPLKGTCYHKNFCQQDPTRLDLIIRRKRPNKKSRPRTPQDDDAVVVMMRSSSVAC